MIRIPSLDRSLAAVRIACLSLSLLALAMPALAAADGSPHLDPTNNNNGTTYTFSMPGSTKSMDPALVGTHFMWRGSMFVFQDFAAANFDADMDLDVNGDGSPDRTLSCNGMVGDGRFSLRCSANDGNGELRFLITGRAVTQDNGKISLRRAGGRGYTAVNTFGAVFSATEQ